MSNHLLIIRSNAAVTAHTMLHENPVFQDRTVPILHFILTEAVINLYLWIGRHSRRINPRLTVSNTVSK